MSVQTLESYFSDICVRQCKGSCCDPWWGIISYTITKEHGLSDLTKFRAEVIKGIKSRVARITEAYVTKEDPPRPLFNEPEKYRIKIKEMKLLGTTVQMSIIAMFAFRCAFISKDKACAIHPFITGKPDIRPPHCAHLGTLNAKPDEQGFCRIIHAAEKSMEDHVAVQQAIDLERSASEGHYRDGLSTAEEAADEVVDALKQYVLRNAVWMLPVERKELPGRNDPCYCGSGKKFKKCHGA